MTSVILINGSFGVGKTSVARALRARLAHSAIYDPEVVGWVRFGTPIDTERRSVVEIAERILLELRGVS